MTCDVAMIKETISRHPLEIVGFGLWWAWLLVSLTSPTLFTINSSDYSHHSSLLSIAAVASGAALSCFIAFLGHHSLIYRTAKTLIVSSGILLAGATLYVSFLASNNISIIISGIIIGIAISLLQIYWGALIFSQLDSKTSIGVITIVAFLCGLVIAFSISDRGVFGACIVSLLPLVCSAILIYKSTSFSAPLSEYETNTDARRRIPVPFDVALIIIGYATAFGIMRFLFLPSNFSAGINSFFTTLAACSVAALILLVIVGLFREITISLVLVVALPLITLGIFILSLVEAENLTMEFALMNSGVRSVDIITWILLANLSRRSPSQAVFIFGIGRGLGCIGALLGFLIGSHVDSTYSLSISLFVFLILFAISIGSFVRHFNQLRALEPKAKKGSETSKFEVYETIASEFNLSKREKEVLLLLGSGRSVDYIAKQLVIANSTVSSHVKNIYRKLDIHNRQDLIDLIETHE